MQQLVGAGRAVAMLGFMSPRSAALCREGESLIRKEGSLRLLLQVKASLSSTTAPHGGSYACTTPILRTRGMRDTADGIGKVRVHGTQDAVYPLKKSHVKHAEMPHEGEDQ